VAPRSGLASRFFIDTGAGVIDADYRGMVKVLLFNHADIDYQGQGRVHYQSAIHLRLILQS
jgi:dUTP pyrophosphatase